MDVLGKMLGKEKHYNPKQLALGTKVEMEHTKIDFIAEKIAQDHLNEDENYYTKLLRMEKKFKHK